MAFVTTLPTTTLAQEPDGFSAFDFVFHTTLAADGALGSGAPPTALTVTMTLGLSVVLLPALYAILKPRA